MSRATVIFLLDWTNAAGVTFPAGSHLTRRGKDETRARANVARHTSTWIHELPDGRSVLVALVSHPPIHVAQFA